MRNTRGTDIKITPSQPETKRKAPCPPAEQKQEKRSNEHQTKDTDESPQEHREGEAPDEQPNEQENMASTDEGEKNHQGPWIDATRRGQNRRAEIRGTRKNQNGNLKAADRTGWLYVGKVHPSKKKEYVMEYLQVNGIGDDIECEQLDTKDSKKLRCLSWNIEGLLNAVDQTDDIFENYDLIILVETFLRKEWDANSFYAIHVLAEQSQLGRPKGGITCLIHPKLSPFQMIHKTDHVLAIRTKTCCIIGVYFQPELRQDHIIDELSNALLKVTRKELLILAGDLNCRIDRPDLKTTTIISFLESEGLTLINNKGTKTYIGPNGSSTIDLVFRNLKGATLDCQRVLENIITRKHLPVATNFHSEEKTGIADTNKHPDTHISRRIMADNVTKLAQVVPNLIETIQKENLNKSAKRFEETIRSSIETTPIKERKAKP
ncbi:hypothetical protein ANN_26810 [Periplaneta americana]|uniref:Endonuclease/exonuclease/phosphatase domain-containing protein n=1 Tax=Periplaneta americana TaxID=6978 RepID=A0ABQ8RZR8_PERAM|nr:hypothetical protein ANN_26810 [Periplaneta americana]